MANTLNGNLAKYGTVGVCIALIGLIGFIVNVFVQDVRKSIDNNTMVIQESVRTRQQLVDTINELDKTIDNFIKFNGRIQSSLIK